MKLNEYLVGNYKLVETDKANLPDGVLARVTYPICNLDKLNHNRRIYRRKVWEKVLNDPLIREKLKNRTLFGHAEHPRDTTQSNLEKTSHIVTEMWIDEKDNKVKATLDVVDTPYGNIVNTLLRANSKLGVSTRADGELKEQVDEDGNKYWEVVPEMYRFVTIDFTADPSTINAIPENVNLLSVLRTGVESRKVDPAFAVALAEKIQSPEAMALVESIKKEIMGKEKELLYKRVEEKFEIIGDRPSRVDGVAFVPKGTADKVYKDLIKPFANANYDIPKTYKEYVDRIKEMENKEYKFKWDSEDKSRVLLYYPEHYTDEEGRRVIGLSIETKYVQIKKAENENIEDLKRAGHNIIAAADIGSLVRETGKSSEEVKKFYEEAKKEYLGKTGKKEEELISRDYSFIARRARKKLKEINEMEVSAEQLKDIIGKENFEKLFKDGHPTAWITHKVGGFEVEWNPSAGKFYIGWVKEGVSESIVPQVVAVLKEVFGDTPINIEKMGTTTEITLPEIPADEESWKVAKSKIEPYIKNVPVDIGGKEVDGKSALLITVWEKVVAITEPPQALASLAKEAGESPAKAEEYYQEAKKQRMEQTGKKEKDLTDDDYQYIMGVVKKRLGLKTKPVKEAVDKEAEAVAKRFALPEYLWNMKSDIEEKGSELLKAALEKDDIDEDEYEEIMKALKKEFPREYNEFEKGYWKDFVPDKLDEIAEAAGATVYYSEELRKPMLQLHDRHLLWEIEVPEEAEGLEGVDDIWWDLANEKLKEFEGETGVKAYALGRSSRHVCVDLTLDNILRYDELKKKMNEKADELVKEFERVLKDYVQQEEIGEAIEFDKEEIERKWDKEPVEIRGKKYRVGKMSYGQFFLEPEGKGKGEKGNFPKGTIWLRWDKAKGKYVKEDINEGFFKDMEIDIMQDIEGLLKQGVSEEKIVKEVANKYSPYASEGYIKNLIKRVKGQTGQIEEHLDWNKFVEKLSDYFNAEVAEKLKKTTQLNEAVKVIEEQVKIEEKTRDSVINDFLMGKEKGRSSSLWFEGDVLYSYGTPIGYREGNKFYGIKERPFSKTTSMHQNAFKNLAPSKMFVELPVKDFKKLLLDKGCHSLGWLENVTESRKEIAILRAEKEKIAEIFEKKEMLLDKATELIMEKKKKLDETTGKYEKKIAQLKEGFKHDIQALKKSYEKDIKEAKEGFEKQLKQQLSELGEKYRKEIEGLKKKLAEQRKEFLNKYIKLRTEGIGLKVSANVQALLEQCKNEEEVDALLENVRDALREQALHLRPVEGEVKVTVPGGEEDPLVKRIGSVYKGMKRR